MIKPRLDVNRVQIDMLRAGISVARLSEITGISRQGIYQIFYRRSTKLDSLKKIADALGHPAGRYLLNGKQ